MKRKAFWLIISEISVHHWLTYCFWFHGEGAYSGGTAWQRNPSLSSLKWERQRKEPKSGCLFEGHISVIRRLGTHPHLLKTLFLLSTTLGKRTSFQHMGLGHTFCTIKLYEKPLGRTHSLLVTVIQFGVLDLLYLTLTMCILSFL